MCDLVEHEEGKSFSCLVQKQVCPQMKTELRSLHLSKTNLAFWRHILFITPRIETNRNQACFVKV